MPRPAHSCQSEDKVSNSLSSHEPVNETVQQNHDVRHLIHTPALDLESKDQSSPASSSFQNPGSTTFEADHRFQPHIRRSRFWTTKEISSAITASENTRMYCALAATLIVVLSYVGFPIFEIVKGVIFFRPLYLLLLTNISIVAAKLLEQKQRGVERTEQQASSVTSNGGYGLGDQLGRLWELAFCCKKSIRSTVR